MYKLPELPYEQNALKSFISEETFKYHYGAHHKAYIDNLNKLLADSPLQAKPLEEVIFQAAGPLFNNAAQAWNHTFYWQTLAKNSTQLTTQSPLEKQIVNQFGSIADFKSAFLNEAKLLFGSGWTWLVKNENGNLKIMNTINADVPFLTKGLIPLMVCDVWEHAYYIDHRNVRANYLDQFWAHINWQFAEKNYLSKEIPAMGSLMK